MADMHLTKAPDNKLVILDCDGVLYPTSQLTLQEIMDAFEKTRRQLGISEQECQEGSAKAKNAQHLGIFNRILHICRHVGLPEDIFFKRCVENIDYSRITPAPELLANIRRLADEFPVCVLTNNHAFHLARVLDARFGAYEKNFIIPNFEKHKHMRYGNNPIPRKDINSSTNDNGCYQPKQSKKGLMRFLKARGVQPQNAVLLDDTPYLIELAQTKGLRAKLVSADHPLERRLIEVRAELTKEKIHG